MESSAFYSKLTELKKKKKERKKEKKERKASWYALGNVGEYKSLSVPEASTHTGPKDNMLHSSPFTSSGRGGGGNIWML